MKRLLFVVLGVSALTTACKSGDASKPAPAQSSTTTTNSASLHGLKVKQLDGKEVPLSSYSGKVLLVVNVASECGYTPQYEGLQALQAKYESKGFTVLGFPSNDFGEQEPGSPEEIAKFSKDKYGVTFPLFEKVKTKGDGRSPVYAFLGDAKGAPKWNFHKYLIDKKGQPVQAWESKVTPESAELAAAIEAELAKPAS